MAEKKKGKKKRTRILIVVPLGAPEWISDEFSRVLAVLPFGSRCVADSVFFEDIDITQIDENKPDWLLVYASIADQEWVVNELLVWLEMHPEVHRHIIYEKPREPTHQVTASRRPSRPDADDSILRDFCLTFSPPPKLPS